MRTTTSGFKRNDAVGKPRYDLIPPFVLTRLAMLYAEGAEKFGENNWTNADAQEDYDSFKASAFRHFIQYLNGAENEDHFARVIFNLVGMEYVRNQSK